MKLTGPLASILAGAAICGAGLESSAQLTVSVTNTFATDAANAANSAASWEYWFGTVGYSGNTPMSNSTSVDDPNSPTAGALVVAIPWSGTAEEQFWYGTWGEGQGDTTLKMAAACITNISFDIYVAPSSPTNSSGNFGTLQVGLDNASGFAGAFTIPSSASNGWVHVSIPAHISGTAMGPEFLMETYSSNLLTGTSLFYLANLITTAIPNYTNNFTNTPGSEYGTSANAACGSSSWIYSNGVNTANAAMSWSSNVNASGTSAPGSLFVSIPWTNSSGNAAGTNLFQTMFGTFAGRSAKDNGETTVGSNFQNLYCSVLVSNTSPMNAAGNYGVLQIGFVTCSNNNWHGITWPASSVTLEANASSGWTNLVVPIDDTAAGLSNVSGLFLEMQTGAAQGGGLPGTTQMWVDNPGATAGPAVAPAPPSFTSASQSGASVILNGIDPGGSSGLDCVILSSPSLSLPLSQWAPVATNPLNSNGTFSFTNFINPLQPAMYFTFIVNIAVTVQANPPGASFTVDGTNYTTSETINWVPGSSHTIATTSPQSGGTGIQYVWSSWSDSGAISHVVARAGGTTYTANFTTQYYLTMNAGAGGSVSPGSGWDNSGAVVPISATASGGCYFSNWTGSGNGSYSGIIDAESVTMNGPITEAADFTTNVPVNISVLVQASPAGASFTVDGTNYTASQVFSWIPGTGHTIATTSSQSGGAGIQYLWSSWSDGGAISHTVNPVFGMTYTANFTTQYYLTMSGGTGGGVSPGSGWENSGTVVSISATANSGYAFSNWTGSGIGSYSGAVNSTSVTMNGPISEAASFTLGPGAASSFTMSTNIGVAPFAVTFTNTSLNSPTSWWWTFGDGGTSTLQNPSHTFTNIWRQTVTLAVTNAYGGSVSSQVVFQCFPCDAVYDWTGGTQGQIATVATLSNSLAPGGNTLGYFTVTNHDLPSPNLQGLIFTNLPGMTNGCPVVFSNGVIDSNFNTTNALAYSYTNDHEWFNFNFYTSYAITDAVWIFYESMPLASNTWGFADEACINTAYVGGFTLNRWLGENGPLLPGYQNDYHTTETLWPGGNTYGSFNGVTNIYQLPNKIYRILMEENTNGICVLAIADPVSSTLTGFTTNLDQYELAGGHPFTQLWDGHISGEVFTNNGLGNTNFTSILAYHDVLSLNRPLTWSQVSNVVMFGP